MTESACSFFTADLKLSTSFYPKLMTAYSEFITLFLHRFFYHKWAEGLLITILYYRNHVFANVDRFGSNERDKRNIYFPRDLHTFSYKGAI